MKRSTHITLADIAQRLDVSRVTVSKALRGHPDISESMVRQVQKVAAELGYSPNMMARNLSARRSHLLGLVVPKIAHYFFGSVIEAVYHSANLRNYETILTVSHEDPEEELRHLRTLVSMRVDGIIVSVNQHSTDIKVFEWIRKMGIPLLFLDRVPEPAPPKMSSVVVDDRGGAMMAVEQAIRAGHRRIACMGGDPHVNIGKERISGYMAAMEKHGLPVEQEWIVHGGYGSEDGFKGLKAMVESKRLPECIFAVTYPVALGVYEAAKIFNVRISRDVDVICFGDSDVGHLLTPSLSCVNQATRELGESAVTLLMRMIQDGKAMTGEKVVIPTQLVLRETCTGRQQRFFGGPRGSSEDPAR